MKVLNFGSLNLDYVYQVDHFVTKGETLSSKSMQLFCGGKGLNQSLALQKAGVQVWHAGVVGPDGTPLTDTLSAAGVDVSLVRRVESPQTGCAIIQNDRSGDNCILLYSGANHAVDQAMVGSVLAHFDTGDWLVLQNEISCLGYIVEAAHATGMHIVLNPSPMDENILALDPTMIDILLLNEVEGEALAGKESNRMALLERLGRKFPGTEIVLTLGEEGSLYQGPEGTVRQRACRPPQVVDTTAAGDTFTGYYLAQRITGHSAAQALETAARASAIAVSRPGAAASIPTREEVRAFVPAAQDIQS